MKLERLDAAIHSSTPISFYQTPDQVLRDPDITVDEKRELLASWSSDRFAVPSAPWLREIPGVKLPVKVNDILEALHRLDEGDPPPRGGMAARPYRHQFTKVAPDSSGATRGHEIEVIQRLIAAHHRNINRYCRLLATQLTDLEREYIYRRIAETNCDLDDLLRRLDQERRRAYRSNAA